MLNVRIAICDDVQIYRDKIENATRAACELENVTADIKVYSSSAKLLEDFHGGYIADVYLLDLEMPEPDGVQVARAIRQRYSYGRVDILFISNHTTHHDELLRLQPFMFVHKSEQPEALTRSLQDLIHIYRADMPTFEFSVGRQIQRVKLESLVYLESQQRKMILAYWDWNTIHRIEYYEKIDDAFAKLPHDRFFMPHQSFIVNKDYVRRFTKKLLYLPNDTEIPIAKSRAAGVMALFRMM